MGRLVRWPRKGEGFLQVIRRPRFVEKAPLQRDSVRVWGSTKPCSQEDNTGCVSLIQDEDTKDTLLLPTLQWATGVAESPLPKGRGSSQLSLIPPRR